jgi:hypothetical protein
MRPIGQPSSDPSPPLSGMGLRHIQQRWGSAFHGLRFELGAAVCCVRACDGSVGLSKDEVQNDLCRVIADRVVNVRAKLKKHATRPMRSSDVLEGRECFDIPTTIKPRDLDWDQSRPVKPWFVRRGAYDPAGYWHLETIELSRTDVTTVLCTAEQPEKDHRTPLSAAGAATGSWPAPEGNAVGHDARCYRPAPCLALAYFRRKTVLTLFATGILTPSAFRSVQRSVPLDPFRAGAAHVMQLRPITRRDEPAHNSPNKR